MVVYYADMTSTDTLVREYFAIVADLSSTKEQLRAVLDPEACFVEMPNTISPAGHHRDVDATLAGFDAGKSRLSEQSIEIHEIVVMGERAAVRSTWRGVAAGTAIVAHMAGFITVRGDRVLEHVTYDCYEPFARGG